MRGIDGEDTVEGDSGVMKSEPLLSREIPAFTLHSRSTSDSLVLPWYGFKDLTKPGLLEPALLSQMR